MGIKSYTPHHVMGEEFIHDYLGMIGLPMDILPEFPADADMVLITEQGKGDPVIIKKIQTHLQAGKSVCVAEAKTEAVGLAKTANGKLGAAVGAYGRHSRGGVGIISNPH